MTTKNAEQDKPEQPTEQNGGTEEGGTSSGVDAPGLGGSSDSGDTENSGTTGTADGGQATMRGGGNKNLPYFFKASIMVRLTLTMLKPMVLPLYAGSCNCFLIKG